MSELFDISTWSVLQWVLVVLAAGFIGQFGKSFAQFLMGKIRAGKAGRKQETPPVSGGGRVDPPAAGPAGLAVAETGSPEITAALKSEAALLPAQKEITTMPDTSGGYPPPSLDKKTLKAQLKQQKKAAKAAKKEAG